jgi:hypothetical protein
VVGPAGSEIEHPAAADGRELVAVALEGDTGTVFVGDREQSAGSVLVEHPGFVHQQQVTRPQGDLGSRLAVDPGPAGRLRRTRGPQRDTPKIIRLFQIAPPPVPV